MNILFIEPAFPANQRQFVRALASVGANVLGIGERPYDWLDDETKGWLKRLSADRIGHQRGRAGMGRARCAEPHVDRPAGSDGRGAYPARGPCTRALRHSRASRPAPRIFAATRWR